MLLCALDPRRTDLEKGMINPVSKIIGESLPTRLLFIPIKYTLFRGFRHKN